MNTADEFMRAVRRHDAPTVARLRAELVAQGFTREEVRDLYDVFGLTALEHNQRLQDGLGRQWHAEQLKNGSLSFVDAP